MFSDIFQFDKLPIFLWQASGFAICERIIKTYIVGNTMNDMLVTNSNVSISIYDTIINLGSAVLWLSIRYVFASHRHIYALKAGTEMQIRIIYKYQQKWLQTKTFISNTVHEQYSLLQKVGECAIEMYSRIAIDLIPSGVSFIIGIYQCNCLLKYPYNIISVFFIIFSDIFHNWLVLKQLEKEEKLGEKYISSLSNTYSIAQESVVHHEMVHSFERQHFEIDKFKFACNNFKEKHAIYEQVCNYQGSLRHWVAHLINGIVLWLSNGNLEHQGQLVMILFYSNEIRRGLGEYRFFQKQYRKYVSTQNSLQKCLEKSNHTKMITVPNSIQFSNDSSLYLENIRISFGPKTVLQNINLNIPQNSFIILLGANGAGKTTLFRIIQQKYKPTNGILHVPPIQNILVCQQEPHLFINESVPYNIAYGCKSFLKIYLNNCISPDSDQYQNYGDSVMEAVTLLEIDNLEFKNISSLSGGEKQRIGLARVLAVALECPERVKLLLLDEYDSALDCRGKELAYKAIEYICELTKCTTISITHNELYKKKSNYKGIILRDGQIVENGKYSNIWKKHLSYLNGRN
jgi:ABC-type bacteriocin/lantibiotic exporter with double-glycine peptidase domain